MLVQFEGDDAETARGVAMQVATYNPPYLSRDDVPADVVENERRIAEATAREEGKPEQALPKIVEGRVNGFFKDTVLLDQAYVRDNKKTVKAVLDEAGVTLTKFVRFAVGWIETPPMDSPAASTHWNRVLLKLGGEMFGGGQVGVDPDVVPERRRARSPMSSAPGSRSPSSSAAATSSAARSSRSAAWTVAGPTTWACSARS